MSANYSEVREVFHRVCELPSSARTAALDTMCGGRDEIRGEVERLLRAMDSADSGFAESSPAEFGRARGLKVNGYEILKPIGEGGMGTVYLAEQCSPRRTVALKTIRPGLVGEQVARRFRREAEALAKLSHPGIARVFEVGVADAFGSPVPYIAMEFVDGVPVTAYAGASPRSTRERLELAIAICDAVDHAHARGVLHRDLKPANILVDTSGTPRILDFGIARITEGEPDRGTLETETGQILGTAAYMSPEQASGDPQAIDERSDVYALGAVVFEMLSGRLPHEVHGLPLPDALGLIRDADATLLGTVVPTLRGDLEVVIAKALEKEPDRRYQSVGEFRDDLRRFLDDRPIVARRPSSLYQLRKFTRRNKALVGGVCGVIVALVLGLIATSFALSREADARRFAEQQTERALSSRDILERVFLGLSPTQTQAMDTTLLRSMLDRAATNTGSIEDEQVRAETAALFGRVYHSIFEYASAVEQLEQAAELFGTLDPAPVTEMAFVLQLLADSYTATGQTDRAQVTFDRAIDAAESSQDAGLIASARRLYAEFLMDQGDTSAAIEMLDGHGFEPGLLGVAERARSSMLRGAIFRRMGRLTEAQDEYQTALALFRDVGERFGESVVLNSLAVLARRDGRNADAESYYRASLRVRNEVDPRPNPDVAATLANLGRLLMLRGDLEQANEILTESLELHEDIFDGPNFGTAVVHGSLAELALTRRDSFRAVDHARSSLGILNEVLPESHPRIVQSTRLLGDALRASDQADAAAEQYDRALELALAAGADAEVTVIPIQRDLAGVLITIGQTDRAEELLLDCLRHLSETSEQAAAIRAQLRLLRAPR